MRRPIYIFGAGGLGREISSMIRALDEWDFSGFFDDGIQRHSKVSGKPVLGGINDLALARESIAVVVAIGDPVVKATVVGELKQNFRLEFPSLLHPGAVLQNRESIRLGVGAIIAAGCILTTDIEIGSHVLLNLNCTVGHDSRIGDYSSIMPGVNMAGSVQIGAGVLIGSGAQILNGRIVGPGAKIGSGAVVNRDVMEQTVVVGVPAREINRK